MTVWLRLWKTGAVLVAALLWSVSAHAVSKRGADLTLEQLTKTSEEIVLGTVKAKKVRVAGRHFETDYEVQVTENLKGKSFNSGKTVNMSVMGGVLTTPPLTQFVQAQPHMFVGENVALFLQTSPRQLPSHVSARVDPKSAMLTTPRVVGMNQGKFSVVTDEVDGKKKIVRMNLEEYGMVPGDESMEKTLQALARRELRTTTGPVVQLQGGLLPGKDGRDPLEKTLGAVDPAKLEKRANAMEAARRIRSRGAVPVQDLQQFIDQVRMFAE